MIYTIYGFVLILIGLSGLAYHGLEVQWKALKQLYWVHHYQGFFKALLTLAVVFYFWRSGAGFVYGILQFEHHPPLMPGEIFIFKATLEVFLGLLGANLGALLADVCIFVVEWIYYHWSMLFLKLRGLNMHQMEYDRTRVSNVVPPSVVTTTSGSGKSPSQVAQRAIAEMEAKQKAAKDAKAEAVVQQDVKTKKGIGMSGGGR